MTGLAAADFWPDDNTQRTVVYGDDGKIWKDNGSGGGWASLVTGLTTAGVVPFLFAGGAESAAAARHLFAMDRVNAPRVLAADGAAMTAIASPPADWSGANQPGFGVIHQGFHWAGGNANAPHTIYRSVIGNHEDFLTTVYSLRVFPGEGQRLVAGLSYKGVLLLWKDPDGVYAVDTSDSNDANWRVIKVGSPGAAGPNCVTALEDDVLWVAPDGSWHLISATTATGSVRAEDITARKLGNFGRDQINLARLMYADLKYYSLKLEAQLACSAAGQTAKNRRLHLDLNRRAEVGERWIWWDRDRNESLFMRKVSGRHIPTMVDNVGQLWELDQTSRNADGSGYTFEWFLRDTDFAEIVPGWQGRRKNLRFVQIEYDGRTAATHSLEVYRDGTLGQTITLSLTAGGATLPATLPFTLGTESLRLTDRRRLRGTARRVSLRGQSTGANEDVSITRILIGVELGE